MSPGTWRGRRSRASAPRRSVGGPPCENEERSSARCSRCSPERPGSPATQPQLALAPWSCCWGRVVPARGRRRTDSWQGCPGPVARSKEREASRSFDLLLQFGSFRVHLRGGGADHTQGVVDVDQRQRCKESELSEPSEPSERVSDASGLRTYQQDSLFLLESSHNPGSTRR